MRSKSVTVVGHADRVPRHSAATLECRTCVVHASNTLRLIWHAALSNTASRLPPSAYRHFLDTANMGRKKRNIKSTSSSVELARASIDAGGQPLQTTEQAAQQDTQTQLPKTALQEDAVADQAAKNTQQIKARLSQLLKEQQEGQISMKKAQAELKVGSLPADMHVI